MNPAESRRLVLVSIFITLALVILAAGILTLGGQQKRFVKSVLVTAVFDNVSGLKTGNNVWFSGVKVGTVKEIKLLNNSQVQVVMGIEEKSREYIRSDAKARLDSESLIGNKIIELYGGTAQAPAIQDNDRLQVEKAVDTKQMMATFQESNKNLQAITSDFKQLSAQMASGKGPVGTLVYDSLLAGRLQAMVGNLERVSVNTERASAAIAQFSNRLNNKQGLANQLLTDTVVFRQLRHSATELQEASAAASDVAAQLKKSSQNLENNNTAAGLLLHDKEFAGQLQRTMTNLEKSSETLQEDLKAAQSNFLLRGYFKDKEKEQKKAEKNK